MMLQREERLGNVKGISICLGAPHLSHLFFVDDSIFFCRANMGEYQCIQDTLQDYDAALGQKINKDKLPSSLARTPKLVIKLKLKTFLEPKSSSSMIDTWVFHPCWVEVKKRLLIVLNTSLVGRWQARKGNSYPPLAKKSSSKWLPEPPLPIP